jgi:hypothetical protein
MRDDEVIDRAAEALTRGEPSPELRQAVRARIDAVSPGLFRLTVPGTASLAFSRRDQARRVWIPVVAAAALVIWVVVARNLSSPRDAPLPSRNIASAYQVTAPVALQPTPALAVSRPIVRRVATRPGRTAQQNRVVDLLVIEPIRVPLLAVERSSGVMPIDIQPLQIEPLQPE